LLGRGQWPRCSPTSTLLCRPPTPCPHQPWLRFPWPVADLDAGACSMPGGRRHVPLQTRRASETITGSPRGRHVSRRGEGLPGAWAVLFVRAMVEHPAGYVPLLAPLTERPSWPSRNSAPGASGKDIGCGAACPLAHTLAYRRFAGPMSETVARLATGLGGLTPSRTGFAPAGRHTKFHEGLATSNSL
jgi:hypothetical protein